MMHWLQEVCLYASLILTTFLFALAAAACPKIYLFNK